MTNKKKGKSNEAKESVRKINCREIISTVIKYIYFYIYIYIAIEKKKKKRKRKAKAKKE